MRKNVKIVLLGDSITQGIGSKLINYTEKLENELKVHDIIPEIFNLALTGTTIEYAFSQLEQIIDIKPDYVVIMYGSVDLQIRPNMENNRFGILSLTPKRYKEIKGILNPRPFMSKNPRRYMLECLDNIYRKIWRKVVLITQGSMQYLTEEQFEENYKSLIYKLRYKIICCSLVYVDSVIYTEQTNLNYKRANDFLQETSKLNIQKMNFVDLYSKQKEIVEKNGWDEIYYKDHFHPNSKGYDLIAHELAESILNYEFSDVTEKADC